MDVDEEEEEEDEEEDEVHATGRFRPSFIHKVPNTSLSPFSPTLKRARSFFECDLESPRLCVCARARACVRACAHVQDVYG